MIMCCAVPRLWNQRSRLDLLHHWFIPASPGQPRSHASCAVQLADDTLAQRATYSTFG